MPPSPAFRVVLADSAEERAAVYAFRYHVYVREMGKTALPGADHGRGWIRDSEDEAARLFAVRAESRLVATLRSARGAGALGETFAPLVAARPALAALEAGRIGVSGRLMVSEDLRGSLALYRLLGAAYDDALESGVEADLCVCAPALVGLYQHLGYRRIGEARSEPSLGLRVPMALIVRDLEHLKAVGSPFYRRLARRPDLAAASAGTVAALRGLIVDPTARPRFAAGEDVFWQLLGERLAADQGGRVPLFDGLSEAQRSRVLDGGTVLDLAEGAPIIRAGEVGKELFVLLDGLAEVRRPADGAALSLIGPGQVMGEIAFVADSRRSADVIALAPSRVLVVTQESLKRLMKSDPETAARLLLNLSRTLCERLVYTTRRPAEGGGDS